MSDYALALRQSEDDLRLEIEALRRKTDRLETELDSAHDSLRKAKEHSVNADRALRTLRRNLEPIYSALRMVFGELDAAGTNPGEEPISSPKVSAVWDSWKSKLGGKSAEAIQALLDHGEMNVAQLKVATHSATQTVYDTMFKLNKLGLINKNGGKYSLKSL